MVNCTKVGLCIFSIILLCAQLSCSNGQKNNTSSQRSRDAGDYDPSGGNNGNTGGATSLCELYCASGCCDKDNNDECISPPTAYRCGILASECITCPDDAICGDDGQCHSNSTQCGEGTAQPCTDGCCNGDECVTTFTKEKCGIGGQPCRECIEGQCIGGTCSGCAPQCDGKCPGESDECGGECTTENATCSGCCTAEGKCVAGSLAEACGKGGIACENCTENTSGNTICYNQVCGPPCNGCWKEGQCLDGNKQDACGSNGEPCDDCGTSKVCSGNKCVETSGCPGCYDNGDCVVGTLTNACGKGGGNCINCKQNTNGMTVCYNQQCVTPCDGCFDKTGTCQPGTDLMNCGTFASTGQLECIQCAGDQVCTSEKKCDSPPCNKCIDPVSKQCVEGNTITACGQGVNVQCKACDKDTQICNLSNKTCTDRKDCPGCWLSGLCKTTITPSACGKGGEYCRDCTQIFGTTASCDTSTSTGKCCNSDKSICR